MTTTTATLDTAALATAIVGRDAAGQLAAYSPDAELVVIDHDNPPGQPRVRRGVGEIGAYLADVCERDMTHEVRNVVLAADRLTLDVACRYPDGTNVACLSIAEVTDGRITRQRLVQAWDH
jgi:ketosteroid isomerase-like protein